MIAACSVARRSAHIVLSFGLLVAVTTPHPARAGFTVFSVGGSSLPASIQATIDSFRAAIGGANNGNAPGPIAGGRREINWDGGGAVVAASSGPTLTGFTNTRGGTFTTPGTGFIQSPLNDVALTGIQASYETTFSTFSPVRIFTPLGSNVTVVTFSLPGSSGATPATVSAFGAVFTDVDLANTTTVEFFDINDALLTLLNVPQGAAATAPTASLSFVGGIANAGEEIAKVRITTGNGALGPIDTNGNPNDLVVMDDFIYSEPIAVPEPSLAAIVAGAWCWTAVRRPGRRR